MTITQRIFIVDDDAAIRDSLRMLLEGTGFEVQTYDSAQKFLKSEIPKDGCVIADIRMPDMGGLELQEQIVARGLGLPVIVITGHGDVPLAVRAMVAGAIDFIEKPFDEERMLSSVRRALRVGLKTHNRREEAKVAQALLALLTPRERGVMDCLVRGCSNKVAAYELGISPRTIEIHRAHVMGKLNVPSLSDLVRISLAAEMPAMD